MKETAELNIQKQIYLLISKQPGLNLSTIANELHISIPLALYHLRYLEKNQLLTSLKDGGYLRYFVKDIIGNKDKKFLSLFRQEILLTIVLFLLKNPHSRHKEILENFTMSRSLLSYHLKKLVKQNIIEASGSGQERVYRVINEEEIVRFLIKYEPYKIFKGLSDTWADFTIR